ncbi:MAG: hypothetical protein H0W63_03890 [Gemmatimonadaceae bacterium]|nr:hypothetical protein [Gemmatimonadaceae bacterium]
MAVTVSEVVDAVRDAHPAFSPQNVPDKPLLRHLSDYQQVLAALAFKNNQEFNTQRLIVFFDVDDANAPGTVGAGMTGGFPAVIAEDGTFEIADSEAGLAVELALDSAIVLAGPIVATSASATTLFRFAAGYAVNAYANKLVVITAGRGVDQVRVILSNTADTLTVGDWTANGNGVIPDDSSVFKIVEPVAALTEGRAAVVTGMIPVEDSVGYLVRLTDAGVPYIDFAKPLVATFEAGIPLPATHRIIGGTVSYKTGAARERSRDLYLGTFSTRHYTPGRPAAYVMGDELFLCGDENEYEGAESIDIRFVPIPLAFASFSDYILLPTAKQALVASGARFAARRVEGLGEKIDTGSFTSELNAQQEIFLSAILPRTRSFTVRDTRPVRGYTR